MRVNATYGRSGEGQNIDIKAGNYRALLYKLKDAKRKKYNSEEYEFVMRCIFKLTNARNSDGSEVILTRDWNPSLDPRAILVKDIRSMTGEQLDDRWTDDSVNRLIEKIVGWDYLVQVDVSESGWRKVVGISSLPDGMEQRPERMIAEDQEPEVYGVVKDERAVKSGGYSAPVQSSAPAQPVQATDYDDDIPF